MNIKQIIKEEIDSLEWMKIAASRDLDKPEPGNVFFIVDGIDFGASDNKSRLRYLIKLGGEYTNERGIKVFPEYVPVEGDFQNLREWAPNQRLDDVSWELIKEDSRTISYDVAVSSIRQRYWRPWYQRHQ